MLGSLPEVLRAFQRVTGCSLQYVVGAKETDPIGLTWSAPVTPGVGTTLGLLRLDPVGSTGTPANPQVDPQATRELASALAGMLGELLGAHRALWEREAELAAGIPVVRQSEPEKHLAIRLQALLQSAAQTIEGHAAALYLLDDATTSLKARSTFGLPVERLTDSPRPLRGALADLEALLGHAVVVDDRSPLPRWNPPEDFPLGVCVPIATPTTILGTLWVFSNQHRDVSDRETNLLEIVAGRLAAELEREMLLRVATDAAQWERQLAAGERLQRNQLPSVPPLLDGWDMAGWSSRSGSLGGQFFDWFFGPEGLLALTVADVAGEGVEAALTASSLRATLRSHGQYHRSVERLLNQANLTLWTGSAGDQSASLFCGLLEPTTGRLQYAVAGRLRILLITADGAVPLTQTTATLGTDPEAAYRRLNYHLEPGQSLFVMSDNPSDDAQAGCWSDAQLAELLAKLTSAPAEEVVRLLRDRLIGVEKPDKQQSRSLLYVKRTKA